MFNRERLITQFPSLFVETPPPIEGKFYSRSNCAALIREDCVETRIGRKLDFRDALHFWVAACRDDLQTAYRLNIDSSPDAFFHLLEGASEEFLDCIDQGRYALCEPMTEQQYLQFLRECLPHSICSDLALPHLGGAYIAGLHMLREWNDIVVFVELSDHFVSIHWFTGA
jgi:hypothetical protein